MDLDTFFRVLLRGWWLILLAVLVTVGSAAYAVSLQAPVYRATTTVELRPSGLLDDPRQIIDAQNSLERRTTINTVARNAMGSSMQEQVASTLGIQLEVVKDADIAAIVIPETNLIEISARSTEPTYAAAIANTVAEQLRKELPEKVLQMVITDRAAPPTTPVEPQPTRTITLGALFGLALGIGFALLGHVLQRMRVPASADVPDETDTVDARTNGGKTQQLFTR
ncbi:MAG TPA: Wzz/FepE/Etk N-terminal domain-containing protein [Herpetosiphonaceae bacterium]